VGYPRPPERPRTLRLGTREWHHGSFGIMAVVNRTPDSFFDRGITREFGAALDAASQAVADGAEIVDIGGVKAGPGDEVSPAAEIDRVAGLVAAVRERHPDVVISVDTWRSEVGEVVAQAGADLLNDAWGGVDPRLAEVAARHRIGLVCSHAGGLPPRARPHRPAYRDVVRELTAYVTDYAERAVVSGVSPSAILVDPAHDFGKNTWQSLEITRRLAELTGTGWPVLVAVADKDFIGETLAISAALPVDQRAEGTIAALPVDQRAEGTIAALPVDQRAEGTIAALPVDQRAEGTIAALAVCAWLGARVFRVHNVPAARAALAAVADLQAAT
jgi:dihydropteroate synthase